MKAEAVQILFSAKLLFESAQEFCLAEEKYSSSAGLISLQDALELVFLAVLIEAGRDATVAIEKLDFDSKIGELKKAGLNVIKSGTLKALNKQRVIVKHYGQLAEPQTVSNYLAVTSSVIDDLLQQSMGCSLNQIFLHELLDIGESNTQIGQAQSERRRTNWTGTV